MPKRLIFVSCGVHTKEERAFGQKIATLIEQHEMATFLAPAVHQPADLNTHVFEQLQRCDGFVAVLQKRGEIRYENFPIKHRGSVWIQQEIGILFYRSFLLGRAIPMRIYREKDVLDEGLTTYSIINPIEFENEETILNDLPKWLRGPTFEKQPVLALREDLFQKRIQLYDTYDWLLLELVAAHSREPGDSCLESTVRRDFDRILGENIVTQQGDLFIKAYSKLKVDGVIVTTEMRLAQYRYAAIRIEKEWWDLVFDELKNRARVK